MPEIGPNVEASIGIFDSGVGGISFLVWAKENLPAEDIIYFGDNVHAPYGEKTATEIKDLVRAGVRFLREKNVKAIVLACNTATAVAIEDLRRENPDFVWVGMEPEIKKPAFASRLINQTIVLTNQLI